MDSTRWERIQSIFHDALALPESERQAFLQSVCGGDEAMMAEVHAMLEEDSRGASLLDRGLPDVAYRMVGASLDSVSFREFGPYRLKRILGEGGMGVVWLADREDTGNLVAVKFLPHAGLSPARRERFAREIKTLAKLKHPFIARLYDAGALADGTPWFVMEYVEGLRFTEFCSQGECPIDERLQLFRKVCEAVQYAHGQEIIHRDLKPSNILVEADGTPRLLDFGIAKELQSPDEPSDRTRPGLRFLSPDYAAPEWVRDGPVGLYTDVYSLGVILYEMLAGRLPVRNMPDRSVDNAAERPSLAGKNNSSLGKAAWSDLDVLCLKAMHANPRERYQSVEALNRDIDHYLNGEPLDAQPDAMRYRLGKFVARNRRSVVAASLTAALVILLVAFFTLRLAKERNTALAEAARTRRIQRFMLDLFGSGDREAAPSNDLRVVTLLDRGAQEATVLNSDPETQAELYENLGRMYGMLGRYQRADELLRLALQKMKSALGPEDTRIVDGLIQLGMLRGDQDNPKEAERLVTEGLNLASRHLPGNDPSVVRAKVALGRALVQSGSYDKAIAVLRPLIDIRPSGEEGTDNLLESLSDLAVANQYAGHYEATESLSRRALALGRQVYGNSHPRVADDLANLGTTEATLGRLPEAEALYREAAGILKAWYGPDHPVTLQLTSFVALALIQQGKLAEADPLLQQVLASQEQTYGKTHPNVGLTLDTLGTLALKRGNSPAAEAYYSRALKIYEASFGETSTLTAMIQAHLGDVFSSERQYARAEQYFREAVTALTERPLPGNVSVGVVEASLGRALVRQNHYREAESHLTFGYAILIKQPGAFQPRLQQAREDLATVYEALQQPDKAARFRAELVANQPRKVDAPIGN
jgi:eukaryotic-like serine/threonine-protein kinase